jgi:nitrogenase molybdenum-iron protein alpha/beta subunit
MGLKFKNPFKTEPSLEELQEREERATLSLSIAQKEALIKKVEAQGRQWQQFSSNGKKSGINFDKIRAWLRGNKGGKK